jgi:hypothetical protein
VYIQQIGFTDALSTQNAFIIYKFSKKIPSAGQLASFSEQIFSDYSVELSVFRSSEVQKNTVRGRLMK